MPSKHELLQFCLEHNKRLSTEFLMAYCGFRSRVALWRFANNNGLKLRR